VTSTPSRGEEVKLGLLAEGMALTKEALDYIDRGNEGRALSSADYASTSGIILALEGDVWVNAPVAEYNPNFVRESSYRLVHTGRGLAVDGPEGQIPTRFWLQPAYHGEAMAGGDLYNSYAFTHADRVRVSPIEGCAFTCKFCDLPYEFRYRSKDLENLIEATRVAISDPIQPARHILISGGTPRQDDYGYVRDTYNAVLETFPGVSVDIMMVPLPEVLDIADLAARGLDEVSINLEVWSDEVARRVMPRKHKQGRQYYLDFLAHAAQILGGTRVRSMLMLGLEPLEATLDGVEAIAALGCVPVLSPFRPDPSTPLRNWPVPTRDQLLRAHQGAHAITARYGVPLGPSCIPCSHNTLTFSAGGVGDADVHFGRPATI
jgi:Radical SAM superfamily